MRDDIESNGLWFLPDSEDDKISGKISYSQEQGIYLELLGSFDEVEQMFSESNNYIILGVLQNGKKITLLNNSIASRTLNFPGIPTVKYISTYMLVGAHYFKKEEILFDEISIEFHNLSEWLSINGINETKYTNEEFRLHYTLPSEINFDVKEYNAKFKFSSNTNNDNFKTFSLNQRVEFCLKKEKTTQVFDFLKDSIVFQGLITFGSFENCYPTAIKLKNENIFDIYGDNKIYKEVELYYKSKGTKSIKQKYSFEFLFNYEDLKDNFQNTISNWYRYSSEIEPIIYLFLNSFYSHNRIFTEGKFLEIIHALETFHRRTYKNNIINKSDYNKQKRIIIESVPQEYRVWLQGKLHFGNEPSLHERLVELLSKISEFKILEEIITDNEQFIRDVKNSRNYYTHYDKSLEKKSVKGSSLYYLTIKLRIILIIHLLLLLELEKGKIEIILQKLKDHHYNFLFHK